MSSSATTTVSLSSAPIGSRRSCRQRERSGRSSVVRQRRSAMARAFAPRRVSPSISPGAQQTRLTRSERIFVRSVERSSSNAMRTAQAESSPTVGTVVHIAPLSVARRTTEATLPRIRFGSQPDARRFIMLSDLWPGLDLRHLAAFSAVSETGSFARGAEMLGYTQPAVSQQVAALEKIVGQRLFERSSGRAQATLTEAGSILAGHVDELTARMAVAKQDLLDLARGEAGSIRVGAFQSALACILPHVLQRYNSRYPAVQVEAMESNNDIPLLQQVNRAGRFPGQPTRRAQHRLSIRRQRGDRGNGASRPRRCDSASALDEPRHQRGRGVDAPYRHCPASRRRAGMASGSDTHAGAAGIPRRGRRDVS